MNDQQTPYLSTAANLAIWEFLEAIREDTRVTAYHVSLFVAIVHFQGGSRSRDKIYAFSHELMPLARISSGRTYHKCIRELDEFGYIRYTPSFDRFLGSEILLLTGKSVKTGFPVPNSY